MVARTCEARASAHDNIRRQPATAPPARAPTRQHHTKEALAVVTLGGRLPDANPYGLSPDTLAALQAVVSVVAPLTPSGAAMQVMPGVLPTTSQGQNATTALQAIAARASVVPLLMGKGRAQNVFGDDLMRSMQRMFRFRGQPEGALQRSPSPIPDAPLTNPYTARNPLTLHELPGVRAPQNAPQPAGQAYSVLMHYINTLTKSTPGQRRLVEPFTLRTPAQRPGTDMEIPPMDLPALLVGSPIRIPASRRSTAYTRSYFVAPDGDVFAVAVHDSTPDGALNVLSRHTTLGKAIATAEYMGRRAVIWGVQPTQNAMTNVLTPNVPRSSGWGPIGGAQRAPFPPGGAFYSGKPYQAHKG